MFSPTQAVCYLRVPFQLASPPGLHVTHFSKGNFAYVFEMFVLHITKLSFPVAALSSAAGDAGGTRVHTAEVWAPAEVRGTCSGW